MNLKWTTPWTRSTPVSAWSPAGPPVRSGGGLFAGSGCLPGSLNICSSLVFRTASHRMRSVFFCRFSAFLLTRTIVRVIVWLEHKFDTGGNPYDWLDIFLFAYWCGCGDVAAVPSHRFDRAALPPLSPAPCRPVMDHGRSGETDHPHGRSQIRRGLHLQRRKPRPKKGYLGNTSSISVRAAATPFR